MKAINTLNELVRAEIDSCPDFVIERAALRVVREFCSKTHIWRVTLEIEIEDEQAELSPVNGEVVAILSVDNENESEIDDYEFYPPSTLEIEAEDGDEYKVLVALTPKLTETTVPKWILERYETIILNGVLGRLFMQSNQEWSNPNISFVYKQMFQKGMAGASIDIVKKFSNKSLRVKPRRFV